MKISLDHISKKFQRYRIFKDISYSFTSPGAYAILGPNGSGKSTLLRLIAGIQSPSSGTLGYITGNTAIDNKDIYKHISFCAPGQEIIEEFTLREFLNFHFSFKKPLAGFDINSIIEKTGLKDVAGKQITNYSSGMKQRIKLAQAIFTDSAVLLLDEPCTNLDQQGVEQYREWIETCTTNRLVIVASNDVREYFFCTQQLNVSDYQ